MINDKKLAAAVNDDDNEQSEKVSWWINESDSLGIEKGSSSNNKNASYIIFKFKTCFLIQWKTQKS
jgi:hypothetical protein